MFSQNKIDAIVRIISDASAATIKLRNEGLQTFVKKDGTIVTNADMESHRIIVEGITQEFGNGVNILSEEDVDIFDSNNPDYFIIDPIDGTTQFANNGEFCINIGFISNGVPTFGAIATPMSGKIYYTGIDGVFKQNINENTSHAKKINCIKELSAEKILGENTFNYKVISGERSYAIKYYSRLKQIVLNLKNGGYEICDKVYGAAAIKYCMLLDKEGDIVINVGDIMSWDIAPAYAMLKQCGCIIKNSFGEDIIFGREKICGLVASGIDAMMYYAFNKVASEQ